MLYVARKWVVDFWIDHVQDFTAMALAIDAKHLAEICMPRVQSDLDKLDGNTVRRFQVLRLCAHATVIQDAASTARRLSEAGGDVQVAKQEALDWQADQDEELNDLKVLECLRRQANTSPLFNAGFSKRDFATTVTVSCAWAMSPALAVRAEGRSLSSDFHRYSLRSSFLACYDDGPPSPRFYGAGSGDSNVIPHFSVKYDDWVVSASLLRIHGASDKPYVVWRLQCDIVDLLSPKPSSQSGRRRRTAEDPCLQLSAPPVEEVTSEESRFNGVRYRSNRRRWIAEMKPPKKKNKHSFGDFKSAAEAARGVDAAFYYYDKPNLLNFPDSPGILSTRSSPAAAAALNDEEKLRFVKAEAKWLASTLPSSVSSESESDVVDPLKPARRLGTSAVQITEGGDAAEDSSPVLSNCANSSQNCEIQTPWMPFYVMSPGIPTVPLPPSPRNFEDEVVRGLLERQ